MMANDPFIKEFREMIKKAFIDKGIRPPKEGSKKEQELYQQWIKTYHQNGSK